MSQIKIVLAFHLKVKNFQVYTGIEIKIKKYSTKFIFPYCSKPMPNHYVVDGQAAA